MKRILLIISSTFIIFLIPFSLTKGQEKKNEQKIKIVVADGSGTNVVIDTVIKDGIKRDSIKLKNGKVIYLEPHGNIAGFNTKGDPENVTVTVSSDGNDTNKEVETITVISSDSDSMIEAGDAGKVYYFSSSAGSGDIASAHQKMIVRSDNDLKGKGEKVIVINDGKVITGEGGDNYQYRITRDKNESDAETTKYVITKDGMKISVEGSDYEKVKALVKEIEGKLDVKKEVPGKQVKTK